MRRQLSEIGWVIGGQAMTALGTIVGVRVLTQILAPAAYGTVSLALGMSTLAVSLVAAPPTQAAIHLYPQVTAHGSARELLDSVLRYYRRTAPWALGVALLAAVAYVVSGQGTPTLVLILTVLFAADCWRSANLSLLNAARRQSRYALWSAMDSWSRPLAATLAALIFGQSPLAVLSAYMLVAIVLTVLFSRRLWPSDSTLAPSEIEARSRRWDPRVWTYALPLLPLGVVNWASGMGDRYIIGATLGMADAGVYAALYGLSSMPFILVYSTAEQGLRPIYQTAVSRGERARARRILMLWFALVAAVCGCGVLIYTFGHEWIASLVVGRAYRHASGLMPWIALGYAIRACSNVFERVSYAYGKPQRVLIILICGVGATALITPLGIFAFGIQGAAMAVPVYFSIQLASAVLLARRTIRESDAEGVPTFA